MPIVATRIFKLSEEGLIMAVETPNKFMTAMYPEEPA
jgi:hypothetical protein